MAWPPLTARSRRGWAGGVDWGVACERRLRLRLAAPAPAPGRAMRARNWLRLVVQSCLAPLSHHMAAASPPLAQFKSSLERELAAAEADRDAFVAQFGQEDYEEVRLVAGWRGPSILVRVATSPVPVPPVPPVVPTLASPRPTPTPT